MNVCLFYSRIVLSMSLLFLNFNSEASDSLGTEQPASHTVPTLSPEKKAGVPPVVHSQIGDSSAGWEGKLLLRNIGKKQQFCWSDKSNFDEDIFSPKSVNYHPDGSRYYINSLEGCKTVVYEATTNRKLKVIEHRFLTGNGNKWAHPSGFYLFSHYQNGERKAFAGKPVEGAFSHGGRYFWVPYYRRTFDVNAQDPSAIAVIDTRGDSIVRMFETGPLPKMVAVSADNKLVAITHWGDNTVGLIDISDNDLSQWHHLRPLVAGQQLKLNFPLDTPVDRDTHSGLKLRGTVFTPDGRYLLVSAMGGPLQVFDLKQMKYAGFINSAYSVRHLVINDGKLYGSQNVAATVISIPLDSLEMGIQVAIAAGTRNISVRGWRTCKVGGGARTLEVSPDGELIFVACNSASEVNVVDSHTMNVVDRIRVDSYPVGLAISPDGTRMIVTSQGRKGFGGNAVNIFEVIRPEVTTLVDTLSTAKDSDKEGLDPDSLADETPSTRRFSAWFYWVFPLMVIIVIGLLSIIVVNLHRKPTIHNERKGK